MLGSAKTLLVSLSVLGLVAAACGSSAKTSAGTTKSTAAAQGPTTTADAAMAPHEMGDKGSFFLKGAEQHSDGKAVVAKMKVLIGNIRIELMKWKRAGWAPPRYPESGQ